MIAASATGLANDQESQRELTQQHPALSRLRRSAPNHVSDAVVSGSDVVTLANVLSLLRTVAALESSQEHYSYRLNSRSC